MKTAVRLTAILTLATLLLGCASPGGYVIGPVSSLTAKSNERALIKRAALASQELTTTQKRDVIRATNMTHDSLEVAVMVGVDLLAIRGQKLTVAEIGKQILGAAGDAVLYGLTAYGLDEAGVFNFSDSSTTINIAGSENTSFTYNQ